MSLISSFASVLRSSLDFWEWVEYYATGVVIIGCVGEYIAEFKERPRDPHKRHRFAKASLVVLIGGLAFELLGTVRTSQLSGAIIANLNLDLERERAARTAMLLQLQPRDFTKAQMDDFVATIKGKVDALNVFTLPDPEASQFGFALINGLERAGVKVSWFPTTSPYFLVPGVSSTGLTLWDDPAKKVNNALSDALLKAGQRSIGMFPQRPAGQDRPGIVSPSSIPVPALFIALRQPAFVSFPEYMGKGGAVLLPSPRKPPWENEAATKTPIAKY